MVSKDMIESKARDTIRELNEIEMRHDSGILKEAEAIVQARGFDVEYVSHTLEMVYNIFKGKVRETETCLIDCITIFQYGYAKVRFEYDSYEWQYKIDFDGCDDTERRWDMSSGNDSDIAL